jgi:hypothetical protein
MRLYSSNCLLIILFQRDFVCANACVIFYFLSIIIIKCSVAALCEFFIKLY